MIGTLLAVAVAALISIGWGFAGLPQNSTLLATLLITAGSIVFVIISLSEVLLFTPLQQFEQKIAPKIIELFRGDKQLRLTTLVLLIFPFVSLSFALKLAWTPFTTIDRYLLAAWVVYAGTSIDLLKSYYSCSIDYLNPFTGVVRLQNRAEIAAIKGDEADMCSWTDSLAETALKAMERASSTLSIQAINSIAPMMNSYIKACIDREKTGIDISASRDKVNYTLVYLTDRLEMLYIHAINNRMESVCQAIIMVLGKMAISTGYYDCLFASYPIRFIGKFGKMAFDQQLEGISFKADCLQIELARAFVEDIEGNRTGLKEPFLTLINHLEENAKNTFKKDKTTKISLLTRPFEDIRELLKSPKVADHPDLPFITKDVERVIDEFNALSLLMTRMPFPLNQEPPTQSGEATPQATEQP